MLSNILRAGHQQFINGEKKTSFILGPNKLEFIYETDGQSIKEKTSKFEQYFYFTDHTKNSTLINTVEYLNLAIKYEGLVKIMMKIFSKDKYNDDDIRKKVAVSTTN